MDDIRLDLEKGDKGGVKQSIQNCMTVFYRDPLLKGAIRKNELTCRTDISKDMGWKRSPTASITDVDIFQIQRYLERNYGLKSERNINKAISIIASENGYHPIKQFLESLEWDGEERIKHAMTKYLCVDEDEYSESLMKLLLTAAIKRIYEPGCKYDIMVCAVGGQGAGKSTFFRFLALNDEWFSDDLKKIDDEQVYRKMQGHWIIEMSEMIATASAKSIEEIKGFLTRQKDTYKIPYDRQPKDRKRQCVFGGTSNNLNFLPFDRTGNRRFLPVLTDPDKAEVHILTDKKASREYIDQMWAEMMVMFLNGECSTVLPEWAEKELLVLQKEYMPEDTLTGIIQSFLDSYEGDYVCSALILDQALGKDPKRVKSYESREVNEIMNTGIKGWTKYKQHRFHGYGQQRSWKRDLVSNDPESGDGFVPVPEQMELPFDNMAS